MLSIVTFKWKPRPGYRSKFEAVHVNTMARMVQRHYPDPHRFICVTDDPAGLDAGIEAVPLWTDHATVPNPSFPDGPSCYRRLKVFSPYIAPILGERFVCIDLDVVLTGDMRPLWNRPEPFVGWRDPAGQWAYNGSMFMLTAGALPEVWESFDPAVSPGLSSAAGMRGSDQGWMSYCLGWDLPAWTAKDGVISFQREIKKTQGRLPRDARIVVFWGKHDPWSRQAQALAPWIKGHYR